MRTQLRPLARIAILIACAAGPKALRAQPQLGQRQVSQPISWTASARETMLVQGTPFGIKLKASMPQGWHLYGLVQPEDGPVATHVTLEPDGAFELAGAIAARDPVRARDRSFNVETSTYTDSVTFMVPIVARVSGSRVLRFSVEYQSCTDRFCVPPRRAVLEVPLTIGASIIGAKSTFSPAVGMSGDAARAETGASDTNAVIKNPAGATTVVAVGTSFAMSTVNVITAIIGVIALAIGLLVFARNRKRK